MTSSVKFIIEMSLSIELPARIMFEEAYLFVIVINYSSFSPSKPMTKPSSSTDRKRCYNKDGLLVSFSVLWDCLSAIFYYYIAN